MTVPGRPRTRLRNGLQLAGTVVAAAIAGLLLVKPVLGVLMERNSVHNGPWRTSADIGGTDASPWTRAAVAVAGLYALSREEAIYYTAFTDSENRPLRGECRYLVDGPVPPARWWSITAYGADHYLVPNAAARYAANAGTLPSAATGRVELQLDGRAEQQRADALPIPATGPFSLTLRLYNPPPDLATQLDRVTLPGIQREACP